MFTIYFLLRLFNWPDIKYISYPRPQHTFCAIGTDGHLVYFRDDVEEFILAVQPQAITWSVCSDNSITWILGTRVYQSSLCNDDLSDHPVGQEIFSILDSYDSKISSEHMDVIISALGNGKKQSL
ncbi:MAG: hypothetical protein R8L53_06745 [Mariprofundales bacterium]